MGRFDTLGQREELARHKASSFTHFRRLLSFVWPQKRYLYPAILCIIVQATVYSAVIGSMLPVLYAMIQPEGVHGWVYQHVAEKRLDVQFGIHDPIKDRRVEGVPGGALRVRWLAADSPLTHRLDEGDFIVAVDGREGDPVETFRALAGEPSPQVTFVAAGGGPRQTLSVTPDPLKAHWSFARNVMDRIPGGWRTPAEKMRTLVVLLAFLLALVLVGAVAALLAEYLAAIAIGRSVIDLRRRMYTHMFNLPLSRFAQNTSDTMSKYVQDMNDIVRGLENFFQKVVTEPIKALGVTCFALWLDWQLTLSVILGVPIALLIFRYLGKKVRRANKKLLVGYGVMLGVLESTLAGMRVVKGYMREGYECRRLFRIDRMLLRQQLKIAFIEALTSPFSEVLGFFIGALAIVYYANRMFNYGVTPPDMVVMLVCLGAIFDPVRKLSSVYPKIQRANAAAERVFDLIDTPSEYVLDAGKPRLAPPRQSIELENVVFQYPGANRPAINGVSLHIKRGETIALVGPNGSGKTTLVSLLPRFYPLNGGRILIDGQDIQDVSLRSLRAQFSLIAQESIIFPDTVRSNIAYGKREATPAEIEAAAKKAFADEFIRQMPQGYDTLVGEHGATLSGGQRQRIAIARAILRDAPILIFDEATSQVDPESEMKIHQALDAFIKDRTAFIIAHRYSTVSGADRIVVMDDGQIVAVGPHEQLLRSCPLYRRLYETQFRNAG